MITLYIIIGIVYGIIWSYKINLFHGDITRTWYYGKMVDKMPILHDLQDYLVILFLVQVIFCSLIWPYCLYLDLKNGSFSKK